MWPFTRKPVSPPAPTRREPVVHVRRYTAARPDRIAGGFGLTSLATPTARTAREDLRGLIAHARQLARDNDHMVWFLRAVRRHVVGHKGVQMVPRARDPNGSLDRGANDLILAAWAAWGRRGIATVCGRYSWLDLQSVAVRAVARDGNFLCRLLSGAAFGPHGFQVQILDIDMLDLELERPLRDGRYVAGGIEFDQWDRPLAYHFRRADLNGTGRTADRFSLPASEVIHLYRPDEPSQTHGVPWVHSAARRLNLLGGYEEAALTAARAGASKMGFLTRTWDSDEPPPEDGATPNVQECEAGHIETLPPGYEFKEFDPGYPTGEMQPFVKVMLRGAAAGLGVSYSALANDQEGANFSSLRDGRTEERDEWRALQAWFSEHFCERIAATWLPMALLTRAIPLPFAKVDKYQAREWRGRGWASVNPVDDMNADEKGMANGVRSPQEVAGERGRSLDDVLEEIAEARKLAAEYGVPLAFAQPKAGAAAPVNEPPPAEA